MSQGYDSSQLPYPGPPAQNYAPPVATDQPPRRSTAASPFASGPVATVNQVRPAAGFPGPPRPAPFRPQSSSQLNTPLGQKLGVEAPSPSLFPTTNTPSYPPPQFPTHQFETTPLDNPASNPFHTANLNGPETYLVPGTSIQQEDPFQHLPDPSLPVTSSQFQAPPPPSAAAIPQDPFSSNFNTVDSTGSDPFGTEPNLFARPPPVPIARRDSFNNPFETAPPMIDPFKQLQYQQSSAPPPPAAPFLNYNTNPSPQYMASPTMFSQTPPAASPKVDFKPPPSPQPQVPSEIITPARTVESLMDEFLSKVAPDKWPTAPANIYQLPNTIECLQDLHQQQLWQQLESKAWSMLGTSDPKFNLHVHAWAMVALMKQGKVDDLEQQIIVLGDLDREQYRYESYPELFQSKTGSFVPIRLRFIATQVPRLKNNSSMYETMASQLFVDLQKNSFNLPPQEAAIWHQIVGVNMVNSFVERKKFDLALRLAKSLYNVKRDDVDLRQRIVLLSRLGRINLQMGDFKGAEAIFAEAAWVNQHIAANEPDCAARILLNQGLLAFAQNKFKEALDAFNTILGVYSGEEAINGSSNEPFESWDDGDVISCAANNMSICALYSCEVQTAVNVLETILQADPRRHLHSSIVFNLSTLYDLVCDNANSTSRKEMIKRLSEAYGIEHIDATSFRI
ncbi:unnamed protein product [Aphanomyces euteiches]|uniref:TPR-like protein n=1 Tax=Aphanomyces euteiches TaxID=100861 RepID=A0A6G0XXV0_9STRA|nr:hypothetical protein Ae201684_000412 [Aphanomyces euteiches]KAH9091707.1 hypothetical protein Ae201684P_011251 [Aphanomyces euteiches]KAH9152826.1 hypothetical protein AeRB84_004820 [Aphanomyces euteiches]